MSGARKARPTGPQKTALVAPAVAASRPAGIAIYYASPLLLGSGEAAAAHLKRIAGLGFDTLLIAPPFRPGMSGNLFDVADYAQAHPLLGEGGAEAYLTALSRLAAAQGMALFVDLVTDHVAADSPMLHAWPELFRHSPAEDGMPPDPRRAMPRGDAVAAGFETQGAREQAVALFGGLLARWAAAGVSGIRALAPQHVPVPVWQGVIAAARAACPTFTAIAWTPGLAPAEVDALAGAGFDRSVASTPWWDGRAPWLGREYEDRRVTLPAMGLVEDPSGPRLGAGLHAPDIATRGRVLRRALALAATTGAGLMMPMGAEHGARRPMDFTADRPADWHWPDDPGAVQLEQPVAAITALLRGCEALTAPGQMLPLSGPGAPVLAFARALGGDLRVAEAAALVVANASADAAATFLPDRMLGAFDGRFPELRQIFPVGSEDLLVPGRPLALAAGEVRVYSGRAAATPQLEAAPLTEALARAQPRIAIERVAPAVDDGRFAVKRLAGEAVEVSADLFADGHEKLAAVVAWQVPGKAIWYEAPMTRGENDRWSGHLPLQMRGVHRFVIEAWRDLFATWRDEVEKKHAAGIPVTLELREGVALVEHAASRAEAADAERFSTMLRRLQAGGDGDRLHDLLSEEALLLMARCAERTQAVRTEQLYPVMADRRAAAFASWYEMFPRSASDDASRHGTFDDVVRHLPRVRGMGFDVLYFTPIHPIGLSNRKGRNNTLTPGPNDPGSPYAIGTPEGGHDALHPELGGVDAFRRLIEAARLQGLEIALDFAIQCSPDHPWLADHPGWFAWRPDGSLRYAENPPKKYEDIVNVEFYAPDAVPGLWLALRDVILHWAGEGVRTFRVDNPHTKPLPFWEWMIAEVQMQYPDAIFLSEAFTRPKMMKRLAKLGFTQSYTYFTWRNNKAELTEYLTELTQTEAADFYRPHFFVNTPDINPVFLQRSGRAGHLIRAALAATLSGLWGVYSGFELCEATPMPGKEDYLDSEKYEIRAWDWNRPGNIIAEVTTLNRVRRENPALQTHLGLGFLNCWNDNILAYRKMTPDRSNLIVAAVSMDPFNAQEASFEVPLWELGLPDDAEVLVEDLMDGRSWRWRGKVQHLRLDPGYRPFALWRITPPGSHA
ncbi:alpha-1,4-glucan:maltose-1-phosphate maltosyltransferase [Humitalea rosea]|uniref:Alpha-1,4-glucan:maltose-1-phosphate maltosyltransferase n=1 Tax=Humitalea rosea TaxID=990373 RepID=A0A2W7IW75_9PROT|nr:maltotransferase domain-containing protein [Humitalea rosea]PZW50517.1 alpha-1,4-glucan:maltose-1-phosphate maltosyltransferase [Humitalea rosea]